MIAQLRNLLSSLPAADSGEMTETLLSARGVRLERIVSFGHVSPDGFWYDQHEFEWVLLLSGRARLAIEGESGERTLNPGDTIALAAHCRHRITWSDPDQVTVWLALFLDQQGLDPSST
jgi:cupin 2 domain-containing protein